MLLLVRCWSAVGCMFVVCGEVEEVVSVLTPVVSGVAQAFHDLLVELQLLLVAEVEEDRQEKGWKVESGVGRVKERQPLTCMAWRWGEMRTRLNLSQCECDEMCKEQDYVRTLSCAVLRKR